MTPLFLLLFCKISSLALNIRDDIKEPNEEEHRKDGPTQGRSRNVDPSNGRPSKIGHRKGEPSKGEPSKEGPVKRPNQEPEEQEAGPSKKSKKEKCWICGKCAADTCPCWIGKLSDFVSIHIDKTRIKNIELIFN